MQNCQHLFFRVWNRTACKWTGKKFRNMSLQIKIKSRKSFFFVICYLTRLLNPHMINDIFCGCQLPSLPWISRWDVNQMSIYFYFTVCHLFNGPPAKNLWIIWNVGNVTQAYLLIVDLPVRLIYFKSTII